MATDLYGLLKVTTIGFTVSIAIVVLMYRRYRIIQRQRKIVDTVNKLLYHAIVEKEEMLLSKEQLLKEVHHRVKNNLHSVICLLETQAKCLKDDALTAIKTSAHRIYAMSVVHQKLYQSEDVSSVDMAVYLPEFISYLRKSFDEADRIKFLLDVEPIRLDAAQAIPIALIVNEAVTNSIKYAFPGSGYGTIGINMLQTGETITLVISDDGIGIDPAVLNGCSDSLGLKLIRGLSEDIRAVIQIETDKGTIVRLTFPAELLKKSSLLEAIDNGDAMFEPMAD